MTTIRNVSMPGKFIAAKNGMQKSCFDGLYSFQGTKMVKTICIIAISNLNAY